MSNVKLTIIYYSVGGSNYQLAKWAEQGAKELDAETKVLRVPELAPQSVIDSNPVWKAHMEATKDVPIVTIDDLDWADAIIFSTPTRFGGIASQMKQFLDTTGGFWAQGKTINKVVSAMTSAKAPHGGQEATILSLYTTMYHWGAIVVTPGYTNPVLFGAGGNPYGTSVTIDQDGKMVENVEAAVKHQAKRTVSIAAILKNGIK